MTDHLGNDNPVQRNGRKSDSLLEDFVVPMLKEISSEQKDQGKKIVEHGVKIDIISKDLSHLDKNFKMLTEEFAKHIAREERNDERLKHVEELAVDHSARITDLEGSRNRQRGIYKNKAERWKHYGILSGMVAAGVAAGGFVLKFFGKG